MMFHERHGSKTRRREDRRAVRNALGTGRDDAPGAEATLRAADSLASILGDATGGVLGLVVYDRRNGGTYRRASDLLAEMRRERESWPDAAGRSFR